VPAEALLDPLRERVLEGMRTLPFEEIYEVGGSLRDQLLGRPVKDVDFLVRGHSIDELVAVLRGYELHDDDAIHGVRMMRAALHGFVSLEREGGFAMP